jgi:hypothetical protein
VRSQYRLLPGRTIVARDPYRATTSSSHATLSGP